MKSEALKEKEYTEKKFLDIYVPKGLSTFSREVISKGSREGMKKARAEYRWQNRPPDGFVLDGNKKYRCCKTSWEKQGSKKSGFRLPEMV